MPLRSEIVIPDLAYALEDVPRGIPAIAHAIVAAHGRDMAEAFLERTLSAVVASALATLGPEQTGFLLAAQMCAVEGL
jgi:hypothetical protein